MKDIVIAGKTIKMTFNMADWEKMEDEVCTVDELDTALKQRGRIKNIYKLVSILAHDEVVTPDWLSINVQPHQLRPLVVAINSTIVKAITRKDEEDKPHDVVLEELQKNAEKAV